METMTSFDHEQRAIQHRRDSDRAYRESRRDARKAAQNYQTAAEWLRHAAWLTRRPDLWDDPDFPHHVGDPAYWERQAASISRYADRQLQSSFRAMDRARFYSGLARRAAKLAEW